MKRECWCDEPRPDILGPTGYALLDFHRAAHDLGRTMADVLGIYKLLERISQEVESFENKKKAR